uniref:Uncharacterized protein n=1 Tax=Chromera velia CCMP2878 TaxID=1169474 RepID=A0A0G4GGH6_9ALVE|eukprot:Cvel_21809.t1-p1 / transcript=Cvel_21809.t1 / gene=Cvel_21809 / organism=Chromera_velia_CCMP2878 / gene_product=hypothetical protein / transcript_product=hypothetical protein / location=Cvel_scaffold2079:19897-21432(-) / protein_length=512 / sequence_SO=supercontig / SO=protein_coding / is_pseudo=false
MEMGTDVFYFVAKQLSESSDFRDSVKSLDAVRMTSPLFPDGVIRANVEFEGARHFQAMKKAFAFTTQDIDYFKTNEPFSFVFASNETCKKTFKWNRADTNSTILKKLVNDHGPRGKGFSLMDMITYIPPDPTTDAGAPTVSHGAGVPIPKFKELTKLLEDLNNERLLNKLMGRAYIRVCHILNQRILWEGIGNESNQNMTRLSRSLIGSPAPAGSPVPIICFNTTETLGLMRELVSEELAQMNKVDPATVVAAQSLFENHAPTLRKRLPGLTDPQIKKCLLLPMLPRASPTDPSAEPSLLDWEKDLPLLKEKYKVEKKTTVDPETIDVVKWTLDESDGTKGVLAQRRPQPSLLCQIAAHLKDTHGSKMSRHNITTAVTILFKKFVDNSAFVHKPGTAIFLAHEWLQSNWSSLFYSCCDEVASLIWTEKKVAALLGISLTADPVVAKLMEMIKKPSPLISSAITAAGGATAVEKHFKGLFENGIDSGDGFKALLSSASGGGGGGGAAAAGSGS